MIKNSVWAAASLVASMVSMSGAWSQSTGRVHDDPIKRIATETYLVGDPVQVGSNSQLLVWVVDNSGSMGQYQNTILDLTVPALQALGHVKWDMALVTTDKMVAPLGLDVLSALDSANPNPEAVLTDWFKRVGTFGAAEESGMATVKAALAQLPAMIKQRAQDVTLVFVTDAPDQSRILPQDFIADVRKSFVNPVQVSTMAMVATSDHCGTEDDQWQYSGSVIEQVGMLSDRHAESWLCSRTNGADLAAFIKSGIRGTPVAPFWTYRLSQRPIDASIEVTVQGRALPRATSQQFGYWTFDGVSNEVVVSSLPARAASNDEIAIRYRF